MSTRTPKYSRKFYSTPHYFHTSKNVKKMKKKHTYFGDDTTFSFKK